MQFGLNAKSGEPKRPRIFTAFYRHIRDTRYASTPFFKKIHNARTKHRFVTLQARHALVKHSRPEAHKKWCHAGGILAFVHLER